MKNYKEEKKRIAGIYLKKYFDNQTIDLKEVFEYIFLEGYALGKSDEADKLIN